MQFSASNACNGYKLFSFICGRDRTGGAILVFLVDSIVLSLSRLQLVFRLHFLLSATHLLSIACNIPFLKLELFWPPLKPSLFALEHQLIVVVS